MPCGKRAQMATSLLFWPLYTGHEGRESFLLRPNKVADLHSCLYIAVLCVGDSHQTALPRADLHISETVVTPPR